MIKALENIGKGLWCIALAIVVISIAYFIPGLAVMAVGYLICEQLEEIELAISKLGGCNGKE